MKFKSLPVTSLEDVTVNFEQLQAKFAITWHPLPYATGAGTGNWQDAGIAGSVGAQYMIDPMGFGRLRGLVKNGTAAGYPSTNTLIGTLPSGFRPASSVVFTGQAVDSLSHTINIGLMVSSAGLVTLSGSDYPAPAGNNGTFNFVSLFQCPPFDLSS